MPTPTVSITTSSAEPFLGAPVHLSCISSIPQSSGFTSFQVEVVWNITYLEDGAVTTISFPPTTLNGAPNSSVYTNLTYTVLSGSIHAVNCSSTLSATIDDSFATGSTAVANTIFPVNGK